MTDREQAALFGPEKIRFERRRYSPTSVFTWVHVTIDGIEYQLGDPWPKLRPSTHDIRDKVSTLRRKLIAGYVPYGGIAAV